MSPEIPVATVDHGDVEELSEYDRTAAVVAHGLLNSMAVICGAATTLRESWDALDPKGREDLLTMIESQGDHVTAMLTDLARGLPAEVVALLDSLRDTRSSS